MRFWPFSLLSNTLVDWLMKEHEPDQIPISDIDRIAYELKIGDVLLFEGRSRVSEIIKLTTRSNWSHAALYIGQQKDIQDQALLKLVQQHTKTHPKEPLLIEAVLGKGVIITPLMDYKKDHVRICRPAALADEDRDKVIAYCIHELGEPYSVRRVLDLLRLLFPITLMPRYLFSSLMNPIKVRKEHRDICSSLLAKAFASVKYPILPKAIRNTDGSIELVPRNSALFTPGDFDYSPYFTIIKYPLFAFSTKAAYRHFPWNTHGLISNDAAGIFDPSKVPSDDADDDT